MKTGQKMSENARRKISEACKGRVPWNKGLTKEDPRVLKNTCGGSRKTQFKKGKRPESCGEGNNNWKGGIIKSTTGYLWARDTNHPNSQNGYVAVHRMVVEKELGRFLEPYEVIHHKDGNCLNNNLDNLELLSQSEHCRIHNAKRRENKDNV